jgi:hypothetical protein
MSLALADLTKAEWASRRGMLTLLCDSIHTNRKSDTLKWGWLPGDQSNSENSFRKDCLAWPTQAFVLGCSSCNGVKDS